MNNNRGLDEVEIKYMIVGTKLRELFFQSYPCLLERVTREQQFALKNGYVRAWSGPVRHLAELRYIKHNKGNVCGMDKKLFSKMFSHLKNDAANSTIQTAEVYQAMPDATSLQRNLWEWGFKSRLFNYVHDSLELYIYKPEKEVVYALLNELARIARQPFYDLPQHIDVEESDPDREGDFFKHGREINIEKYDLTTELKKWNEAHGTNLEFKSYVPIYGKVN
jgi:DNA polymerase I-like protein with 3'-5' exonuclease and polymerase domains